MLFKHVGQELGHNTQKKAETFTAPLIRPPGAVSELSFLLKCNRCNLCKDACPHNAIQNAGPKTGSAMGTPIIEPEQQPCHMCTDFPCISACPESALVPIQPHKIPKIGTARLIPTKCLAFNGQICDYCHDCCPEKDKAITMQKGKPLIIDHKCTGCGICEFYCPATSKAIRILPFRDKASEQAKR